MNVAVKTATVEDAAYVVSLQKKFSNALGFLPRMAILEYLQKGQVLMATENGDPAAYILYRPSARTNPHLVTIVQTAVQFDAQRHHIGLALLDQLHRQALTSAKKHLACKCAADLLSNSFWLAAGFAPTGSAPTCGARGRTLISYQKPVSC